MTYTPGPWHLTGIDNGQAEYHMHIGAKTSPMVLASINPVHIDSRANARLIIAAPDMHKELLGIVKRPDEAMAIFKREGFIFDDTGGPWQKLAFTLYTMLVADCENALGAIPKDQE